MGSAARRRRAARARAAGRACRRRDPPASQVHVRAVRNRRGQPLRARRRAGRRGAAGSGLQPALPPRPTRPRQDPPPACDRQLRRPLWRRPAGPLRHHRGVHHGLRGRGARAPHGRFQGGLSQRRRGPDRRRPVPRRPHQDPRGVLPHLQRAARFRAPARDQLRPQPRRAERPRDAPGRAVSLGPRGRARAPAGGGAPRDPAQARRASTASRSRRTCSPRSRPAWTAACEPSRAR